MIYLTMAADTLHTLGRHNSIHLPHCKGKSDYCLPI